MANEELVLTGDVIQGSMEAPKNLDRGDLSGTEGITLDEIRLPRLCIAQGLSTQLVPGDGTYIKGLVIGEMFNDVTETIYGNGPLTVVPVLRKVTRIEFDPNQKGVPLNRNVPAGDPRLKWNGDEPPRATEYVEFVSLVLQPGKTPEPIIVSIKTTNKFQRRAAENWTTYVAGRRSAIYTGLYLISTKIEKGKNRKGQDTMYGVFLVKNAGYIPTDVPAGAALHEFAKKFHESLQGKTVGTVKDREGDNPDAEPAPF